MASSHAFIIVFWSACALRTRLKNSFNIAIFIKVPVVPAKPRINGLSNNCRMILIDLISRTTLHAPNINTLALSCS